MLIDEEYLCNFLKRLQFLKENIFVLDSLIQRLYKKMVLTSLNGLSTEQPEGNTHRSSLYSNRAFEIKTYELKRESQKIKYMALRYKVRNFVSESIHGTIQILYEFKTHQIPHDNVLDIKSFLYKNPKFLYDDEDVIHYIRLFF